MNTAGPDRVGAVLAALKERPGAYLVAIAGIPGAGKTTLSAQMRTRLPHSMVLPMDGYHLQRAMLDSEGLRRRGAQHTFDSDALRRDLERLRESRQGDFPAFDHAEKDPRPGAVRIGPDTEVVIVEGLYLLMRAWRLEPLFDLTVFLDCDIEIALDRVAARHLECGLVDTPEAGRHRVESNDRLNALVILADGCRERADLVLG